MRFVTAMGMLTSLIGMFIMAMLAMAYVYEGHGLHPGIAGTAAAFMGAFGYWCAGQSED